MKYFYIRILSFLCNISPSMFEFIRKKNIKGKGSLGKHLKLNGGKDITADCNGISYKLYLDDDVQMALYLNIYEKDNIKFILAQLKEGDTFFDVGANVGAYTVQAARRLGTGENIYSFEPEPDNFKRLDYNCNLNEFSKNVKRHELALTSFNGMAALFQSEKAHSGWHSLTEFKDISRNKIEVKTATLDSFIENHKIQKIDLIKIDVEANEFELLEGAVNSLKKNIFKIIYIEFNGTRLAEKNKSFTDFINLFKQFNYSLQKINTQLAKKLLRGELDQRGVCENFLFMPYN